MKRLHISKKNLVLFYDKHFAKIVFVIAFVCMILLYPNVGKFKYAYRSGTPWMYETLMAPFDFPILKTSAEINQEREQVANQLVSYFKEDNSIAAIKILDLQQNQLKYALPQEVENNIENSLIDIYDKGVIGEEFYDSSAGTDYVIVQQNKRAQEQLLIQLYTPGKALRHIKSELMVAFPEMDADSLMNLAGAKELVEPNLIYDQKTTNLVHKEAMEFISPTKGMVYAGELIVSQGEIVTPEIEQLLDSYKAEYNNTMGYSGGILQLLLGHSIVVVAILILIYVTLYFVNKEIFYTHNKFFFLIFITILILAITALVWNVARDYFFMVPYSLFALYTMAFFRSKLVFPLYMISLIPLLVISEHGTVLYLMNVVGGAMALYFFSLFNRGWLQFFNSFMIFVGMLLVYLSFIFMANEQIDYQDYIIFGHLFLNALFVVAAYPLLFLLEKLFGLVSGATLRDLSDTNTKVLKELASTAPGTFQHSLQVANLAEHAVAEIGGDTRLVRVGALYHDIGKMNNPQCFIENQAHGIDYHKNLSPVQSAKEILAHVTDGVELARKYNSPDIITGFITSHHGCTQASYFYNKYIKEGGNPKDIALFTYKGTYPATKEQVVLMIADSVEAASRTLNDYTKESISNLVDSILRKKISESQFENSDITYKEVNIVRESLKRQLAEIYHARISYK